MKKLIIRFIIFMLILFIILLVLSRIVLPKNNSEEAGMNNARAMKILGEDTNTVDMIVYGDSEAYASIIPMQLWNEYGFTSFVCATSGQTLPDSCRIAYDTLKNQSPKIVILEADTIYLHSEISVPIARVLYGILPILEYHNRWKDLKPNDFFGKIEHTERDVNKGYYYLSKVDPVEGQSYMEYSDEIEAIPKLNKIYVKLLKAFCEYKGAEFAIVSVPSYSNWSYKRHNGVKQFAEAEGIEFIDLNEKKDEINIDWTQETADKGDHVNYPGAKKVTKYLGEWLKDKNILESHKDNIDYNYWNEDLRIVISTGDYY